MAYIIEALNVCKAFGSNVILDDVSCQVGAGENLVLFGKSGTGKSVLLKCIIGLLTPDSGEILFEGKSLLNLSLKELNEQRKMIGFLFQSAALYDSMSVRENLEFPLIRNFKFSAADREKKVKDVLEKVSLENAIDIMPSELSGGMKKRIGLARTIISEPKLILYDEPTTGLDPITTKEISHLINNLQRDLKISSLIVTHDLMCANIVADKAIVLNEGKIIFEGKLEELTKKEDKFLKDFFSPEEIQHNSGSSNG
ncbi:MAG: ATP-binding cassette domain-containing protein [Bacteroidota bacterium]|nr:ATP-binding cassette domain-containing protein [Bacteroidota bacterium]